MEGAITSEALKSTAFIWRNLQLRLPYVTEIFWLLLSGCFFVRTQTYSEMQQKKFAYVLKRISLHK